MIWLRVPWPGDSMVVLGFRFERQMSLLYM